MHELDMRNETGDHNDINGPHAHRLIRDVDVTAARVTRFRQGKISHRSTSRRGWSCRLRRRETNRNPIGRRRDQRGCNGRAADIKSHEPIC